MMFRMIAVAFIVVLMVAALAACATKPPVVNAQINCPQPTAEALSSRQPLPRIPVLSTDPGEAIGALSVVIASDEAAYDTETKKRETLIEHGVRLCGWTR